jgi:WXG100 family type VII secretion target
MPDTPGVGQVTATTAQLNAMAQRCQETRDSIAEGMARLVQRIESIAMKGATNSALQEKSVQLNQGLRTVMDALDELSGKISSASTQYGVRDEEAAQDLASIAAESGSSAVTTALRG